MSAAEIAANNRAFERAVETGEVDAIAALLAPDVMALPPDGPIVSGKDSVKQLWASAIREHGMKSCRISSDKLDFAGDMASEVGHATNDHGAAGRQGRDGQDKICRRMEAARRKVAAASRHLERSCLSFACGENNDGFAT